MLLSIPRFSRLILSLAMLILVLSVPLSLCAQGKKPAARKNDPPANFLKTCKAATALVILKDRGSGSAFCIRKDGLFLTNRHVAEGVDPGSTVELVLNAGEKSERVLHAKVVHISEDEAVDLALLKVTRAEDLTPLVLGDDSSLEELATVTAFGFPFGRALASGKNQLPNVTVTSGKISALRRLDDRLAAIQVDAAINPGCSGGPLVDQQGKVVGVVFAGVALSGIAFAVPVSKVHSYLETPRLVLSHPEIRFSDRYAPQTIEVEVVEFSPSKKPFSVELTLQPDNAAHRTVALQKKGDVLTASEVLFEKPKGPRLLHLKIWRGRAISHAHLEDQPLKFGTRSLLLSACRIIERRPDAHLVTTIEGDYFATPLADLPQVSIAEGLNLDLDRADRIQMSSEDVRDVEIAYALTARRKDDVIATTTGVIRCSGQQHHYTEAYPEDVLIDDPSVEEYTIEAEIDGKSTLVVRGNGMWWEHQEGAPPGTKDGTGSFVLVNGRKWYLNWSRDLRGESRSEVLSLAIGGLTHQATLLSVRDKLDGPPNPQRGSIELIKAERGIEPTRVTFNDTAGGAGFYKVQLAPAEGWEIPAQVAPRHQLPTSARWSFNEDTANRIQDTTGNGHEGHGPAPTLIEGQVGQALALDGGHVNCGNIGDFDRTSPFSIAGWFYLNSTSKLNMIAGRIDGRSGYRGYELSADAQVHFQLISNYQAGNALTIRSFERLKPFCWYHAVATYDGSGNSAGVRLYLNGADAPFLIEIDRLSDSTRIDCPFRIGVREPGTPSPEPLNGCVDEIRLYSRVLRPDEVRELAVAETAGQTVTQWKSLSTGLVGAWSFDRLMPAAKTASAVEDVSGNGHHGKLEFTEQDITFEAGRFGKAVRLNGRVIQFGIKTGDFERTDAFSYGCWVHRTDKANQSLFSKFEQRLPYRGYDLELEGGLPKVSLISEWAGTEREFQRALRVLGQESIPPHEWHHVFVTYDGTSQVSGVTIYLDGKPMKVKVESDTLDGSIRTVTPLRLGNRFNETANTYEGLIDDAVIYARCLTSKEVNDLVAGTLPK